MTFSSFLCLSLPKSSKITKYSFDSKWLPMFANSLEPCLKMKLLFQWISMTSPHESMFMKTSFHLLSPMKSLLGKCWSFKVVRIVTPVPIPHDQTWSVPHEVRWGAAKWFKLMCKIWTKAWPQLLDLDYSQCPCCPCA